MMCPLTSTHVMCSVRSYHPDILMCCMLHVGGATVNINLKGDGGEIVEE